MKPAPVTLPANIKNVAIVNRSLPSDQSRTIDAIHKALNLESATLQKDGSRASVRGLLDELSKNNRFTSVKSLSDIDLRTFGAGTFPSALEWDSVAKICHDNNVDALFALEMFDTESKVNYGNTPGVVGVVSSIANVASGNANQVNMVTQVRTGWRIYDPASKNILDEYILAKDLSFIGRGITPVAAVSALITRPEAVKQVGNQVGAIYASRITPYWIRVSREYFVRGSDNFKMAMRMARTGNWDNAGKLWQQETTNPSHKRAGRACYNMAIISEINGDIDGAMQWAQRAYENYGITIALPYVNILRHRKDNEAILQDQANAGK
jgi:hypothetical protein